MTSDAAVAAHSFLAATKTWSNTQHASRDLLQAYASLGCKNSVRPRARMILGVFAILICFLGTQSVALAQSDQSSWTNLSALAAGQKIKIVEADSKTHSGTFVALNDSEISLQEAGSQQTIARKDVRSVKLMDNTHRLRHALIGAAIGAGAGAGIAAGTWENHGYLHGKGTGAAVGAIIGGIGGAVVGAVWPSHKTIFRAAH